MVAKIYFEPKVEKIFYENSYGYRPNQSAKQVVGVLRERCWRKDWVVDFDIKGLLDNIRHDYLIEMVKRHTNEQWIILYIKRWIKTPFKMQDGTIVGKYFTSFLPAISNNAQKAIRKKIRNWRLQLRTDKNIKDIANKYNSKIQGWINYYSQYYKSEVINTLSYIDMCLVKWVKSKYKKKNSRKKVRNWLKEIEIKEPMLFAHWKFKTAV